MTTATKVIIVDDAAPLRAVLRTLLKQEGYNVIGEHASGAYSRDGAPGKSILDWLHHGQLSLTQARSIAGNWKTARRAGRTDSERRYRLVHEEDHDRKEERARDPLSTRPAGGDHRRQETP